MKKYSIKLLGLLFLGTIFVSYENCGMGVNFSSPQNTQGLGNNTGTTGQTLKMIQPTFAVRGLNCMACHGIIGSNIVTDFGYGTANFQPLFTNISNPNLNYDGGRTAFNDIQSGWQNLVVSGSVHVPNVAISASDANTYYGITTGATTLSALLQMPNLGGNGTSMVSGVTPQSGSSAVIVDSTISISYPSQAEIINLLPSNLQNNQIAVSAINVQGVANSSMSGFGADSSGNFIRNNSSTVSCYGDVVVKGPLFLQNLNLQTDGNGCRLYVSNTVFIEGPITYVNGGSSNLQISSASAIVMGFSTLQMGAAQAGAAVGAGGASAAVWGSTVRIAGVENTNILTVGGPYGRFGTSLDSEYNPSSNPINGVPSVTFFDNIVSDGLLIGSELVDAGEPAAINNLIPGESIVTETDVNGDIGSYGGRRVAINYTGLLLNAPQVHSRYGGNFQGVVIADVAMLARNPANNEAIEQFAYDPVFNSVSVILPALTTNILNVQP